MSNMYQDDDEGASIRREPNGFKQQSANLGKLETPADSATKQEETPPERDKTR